MTLRARATSMATAVVLVFGVSFAPARAQAPAASSGKVTTVAVAGHMMRVRTAHLADRKAGQPVVVLEGGSLQPIETWDAVFDRVAALGPVIAYDRRGIGRSEFDGEPQTLAHVAGSLHALLTAIKVTPPLVLVGHSYGGPIVSAYALAYPKDVAGLVYLDAPDVDQTEADLLALSADARRLQTSELNSFPPDLPAGMRAEVDNLRTLITGNPAQMHALHPPAGIPMAVVVAAGKVDRVQDRSERAIREGILQIQIRHEQQWALSAPDGLFLMTRRGGHFVHQDNPDLTAYAIQHVLAAAPR
jgi:pimeloyl-ACP methyl ester carboxylesterase